MLNGRMMTKPPEPLQPRHPKNPVGQTDKIGKANKAIRKDLANLRGKVIAEWQAMPVRIKNVGLHNQFYEYLIDLDVLRRIVGEVRDGLSNGEGVSATQRQTEAAYANGTGQAVENLSRLSEDYTRQITTHLGSSAVQRRASLAGARVFEQMEGFAGQTGSDLGRVLFSAVQSGENPRETAKRIRERFGVAKSRAERISRTEITGALRRGRWDEARDAQETFNIETRLIHYSALIPGRTRASHAARHGKIVTVEEQAEWYERNGNGVNCLCTAVETLVDANGDPVTGKQLQGRMKDAKKQFEPKEV